MARKAKLDEIDLDFPPEDDEQLLGEADEEKKQKVAGDEDYEGTEDEGESHSSFLGGKTGLAIFCILGCLLIVGVVWGTWYLVEKDKQSPPPLAVNTTDTQTQEQKEIISSPSISASTFPEVLPPRHMVFQGFMIPLPEGAKFRLLGISFAVEVVIVEGKGVQKGDISNDPGVRRQIINAIQSRGLGLLQAKNSRALVKSDLLNLMTQIFGENVVKNVYITEYTFI